MVIGNHRTFVKDHLKGKGLEIGAYFQPLEYNPETTQMTYQDRYSTQELIEQGTKYNPEAKIDKIVNVDVVSPAHICPYPDDHFDFVCNSHVFEHLKNPIEALKEWLRVTKINGFIYLIVPDKKFTFDKDRELTPLDDILRAYYRNTKEDLENKDKHEYTYTYESLIDLLYSANFRANLVVKVIDHKLEGIDICVVLQKL